VFCETVPVACCIKVTQGESSTERTILRRKFEVGAHAKMTLLAMILTAQIRI